MSDKRFSWAALLLGFGLGGFFDGILLHQILQWHHLLSAVRAGALADLRGQVVADGVFHALMYAVASAGLWLASAARAEFQAPRAPRLFAAFFFVGFGAWHVVDAVLSHWLTGIHHIRMDVPDPVLWDVLWLAVFGLLPLVAGLEIRRGRRRHGPPEKPASALPAALIGATVIAAAASAWTPGSGTRAVSIALRPGASLGRMLVSLSETDARLVWVDPAGSVVVVQPGKDPRLLRLYREGALYVSGTLLPSGCSAWLQTTSGKPPA